MTLSDTDIRRIWAALDRAGMERLLRSGQDVIVTRSITGDMQARPAYADQVMADGGEEIARLTSGQLLGISSARINAAYDELRECLTPRPPLPASPADDAGAGEGANVGHREGDDPGPRDWDGIARRVLDGGHGDEKWRLEFAPFVGQLAERLEKGAREYGDDGWDRPAGETAGELAEEAVDVAGWGMKLWARIRRLARRLADVERAAARPHPQPLSVPGEGRTATAAEAVCALAMQPGTVEIVPMPGLVNPELIPRDDAQWVAIDLDGTLSQYTGWRGSGHFGMPIRDHHGVNAREFCEALIRDLRVNICIHTTRGNVDQVAEWLNTWDIPWHSINSWAHNPPECSTKPIAIAYVDDRAIRYTGDYSVILAQIERETPTCEPAANGGPGPQSLLAATIDRPLRTADGTDYLD
jgi:hypothetical protein